MCSKLFRLTVLTGFNSLTIRKELDFKSNYLFRMCSVVTNLVTSLEFQPIRCATTLFHFGRTRNGYVVNRTILLSSTAESSATSGYVVAPERSGQIEAWASRNVERARKKPSLFPTVDLTDATCNHEPFLVFINLNFCTLNYFPQCFLVFSSYGNFFHLLLMVYVIIYCAGERKTTLMSFSDGSDPYPYFFHRKMEKTRSVKEEKDGEVLISRQSRHLFLYK